MMSYVGRPAAPDRGAAVASALVFAACGLASLTVAIVSLIQPILAVDATNIGIGFAFYVENGRFIGIFSTLAIGLVTLVFARMLGVGRPAARGLLVAVAVLAIISYMVTWAQLASYQFGLEEMLLMINAALLWLTAMVSALLPATGRALRRH